MSDLVIIFSFVALVILIITAGVLLFPIARKLGVFLEEAAIERKEARLSGKTQASLPAPAPELDETLDRLEAQLSRIAERQAFLEELVERRVDDKPSP